MSGSSALVSWLLRRGLLDRLDLLVFPVVLGSGKRLFGRDGGRVDLRLVDSTTTGSGLVILTYRPA
jgi:dihydrofolate reductase